MSEPIAFAAADGHPLRGELFLAPGTPDGAPPQGAVVIAPATGVGRRFYAAFARYLSEAGFAVLTFDYRGIGGSREDGPLRRSTARMHEWGALDLDAALRLLEERFPTSPLLVVGHSVGGQVLGLAPASARLKAVLTVGAQSGYWGHWSGLGAAAMAATVFVGIPLLTRLFGVLPMRRLGQGEDLPPGVALEWARWCRHPDYVLSHAATLGGAHYAAFRGPWLAYAISDDGYAPRAAVEALLRFYPNARGEVRTVTPAGYGASAIGHFQFFREKFRESLWPPALDWITAEARK